MGLFNQITDPLDLFGGQAAENAKDAAEDQVALQREAIDGETVRFNQIRSDLQPFVAGGQGLAGQLAAASTINGLPLTEQGRLSGIGASNQPAPFSQGELAFNVPATPAEVAQLYREILGREPDSGGLQYYIDGGFSPAAIARAHRSTQEYRDKFQAGALPRAELGLPPEQSQQDGEVLPRSGGFAQRIDELSNSGALDPLIRERFSAAQNQISSSGLRRSGAGLEAAAAVPTEVLLGIEDNLFGRLQNTVGSSQNAAAGLGAIGSQNQNQISTLLQAAGNANSQGVANANAARAQGTNNAIQIGAGLLAAFSDRRLKTNVRKVDEAAGLNVYLWQWIDEAPDFIKEQPNFGFMADEVVELYPHAVEEVAGFLTVDYSEVA